MLKCRDMVEMATAYMEGALSLRARTAMRLHLWLCDPCRRYLGQLRGTVRLLGAGPPSPPHDEAAILARLTAAPPDPP